MLEVKNLQYQYKGKATQSKGIKRAKREGLTKGNGSMDREGTFKLEGISFTLEKGYIMGLLGLNGAGKSTLMNLLMGIFTPDKGSVAFHGKQVSEYKNKVLQKIACVSDKMEFLRYRSLDENVELFGILYDDFDRHRWEIYMESFGFEKEKWEYLYDDLSTGEKRKFQLAFALSYEPELLLLDEPTANLDPHARVEWMELIQRQVAEEEISTIISTHLTSDLDEIADYILVLDKGKQLAFMDREEMVDQYGEIELSALLLELTEEGTEDGTKEGRTTYKPDTELE